jgi:hypothetical protein
MAATDEQVRQSLSKYISGPTLDKVVRWLGEEAGQDPSKEGAFRKALAEMGIPAAGIDALVQVGQARSSEAAAQAASEFAGLTGEQQPTGDPDFDVGAHGGGTIDELIADHGMDVAATYMTPEQRMQYLGPEGALKYASPDDQAKLAAASAAPDLGGVDWSQVDLLGEYQRAEEQRQQAEQERQAAAAREADLAAKDKQFGHDLSWLDPSFQQDPTKAITEAQKLGTSADPELVKQQQSLVDEVRARGLTADKTSRDAQQGALDELMGIYNQGGQTARDKMLRAKARADSENWLKGQREADMASMAERGVDGSGAEVLSMLGDRQDAATRLSAADLQASADAEQRALDARLSGSQVARGMESSANAYQAGNTAAAGGILGDMRGAADAYQRGNAEMIAKIGQTNTDYLRQAQSEMLARRNDWDKYVMSQQGDMAKYLADLDARDNAAGHAFGGQVAGADTAAGNAAQGGFNAGTQGAFAGQTGAVRGAGNAQTAYTGEAQAHAGKAFSGAAQFVGNLFSGLYGGGGGGGNDTTQLSGGSTYTPAGEQTGMDEEYR